MPYVILFAPKPTRAYEEPEVYGPFASEELAHDYIDHSSVSENWTAEVHILTDPYAD